MELITFGATKETGAWWSSRSRWRLLWSGHDSLFIAAGRLRVRMMKPGR